MRSRNQRSWETTTAQPANASSASSSARSVSTSRSLVGSSSSSRLPPVAQQLRQVQAVALAARQLRDLLLLVGALEVEAGDVGAAVHGAVAELDLVLAAGDLLPDVLVGVERVARLVDVGELDRLADLQRARVGLLLPGDHPQQRRLAGAVRADHADDPAAGQVEAEVIDQHAVAVGLAELVCLDDDVAEPRAGRDVDLDLVELDVAVLGEQRLVGVQPRLRLVAARAGVEPHPLELLVDRPLARALLLLLLLRGGRASARASPSSCPGTGSRGRGRARGSSRRRCRGSSGRG